MTEAPTNKGTLTDKEGTGFPGCRILVDGEQQDRAFTILSFVQKFLDQTPKKARVCFTTKDGKISKIWEDKEQAQQQGNNTDCTSVKTPAGAGLKTVEGQIVFIDPAAHKITVKDREGTQHTMIWPPPLNDQMSKLKQWWFTKITGEHQPDVDLWKLISQEFFKRPDDWPASSHGGGKGNWKPANDKAILFQCLLKAAVELRKESGGTLKDCVKDAADCMPDACKAAGVM